MKTKHTTRTLILFVSLILAITLSGCLFAAEKINLEVNNDDLTETVSAKK